MNDPDKLLIITFKRAADLERFKDLSQQLGWDEEQLAARLLGQFTKYCKQERNKAVQPYFGFATLAYIGLALSFFWVGCTYIPHIVTDIVVLLLIIVLLCIIGRLCRMKS